MKRGAIVALVLALQAPGARATERWYGWQVMAADGAAVAIMLSHSVWPEPEVAGWLAAADLALGGPAIHFFGHDAPKRALASLALRTVPAGLGWGIYFAYSQGCFYGGGNRCEAAAMAAYLGTVFSLLGVIVDYAWLSFDRVPSRGSVVLEPVIAMGPSTASFGLRLRW